MEFRFVFRVQKYMEILCVSIHLSEIHFLPLFGSRGEFPGYRFRFGFNVKKCTGVSWSVLPRSCFLRSCVINTKELYISIIRHFGFKFYAPTTRPTDYKSMLPVSISYVGLLKRTDQFLACICNYSMIRYKFEMVSKRRT